MNKHELFTYLLTYGGALLALANPFLALLAYVAISILKPHALWHWSVQPGNYSFTIGAALFVGWLVHGCGSWKLGRAKPIVGCLLGYWVWSVVCAFFALDQEAAWEWVITLAKIVVPFLVGVTVIDSVKKLKLLAWTIVLCHGYLAYEFNLSYFGGHNRLWTDGFGGMDNNNVVVSLVATLALAVFLGLETPSWILKALAFGSVAFMGHAILFSFSRGGMLATGVVGLTAFVMIKKTTKHYLAFAVAAAFAIYLAGAQVRERLFTSFLGGGERDSSAQSRINMWKDCADCIAKNPVVGVGPRSWPLVAKSQYGWLGQVHEAHNLWLQTGTQMGIPGMMVLLAFYGLCLVKLWPLTRGREPLPDPWLADAARMVITALVGFLAASQFVSIEPLEVPYFINLLGVGILRVVSYPPGAVPANRREDDEPVAAAPPAPPPLRIPERPRCVASAPFRAHAVVDLGDLGDFHPARD